MDIVLGGLGNLIVHHVGNLLNVETAGGEIRGHQHLNVSSPEGLQCPGPRALALVAVKRLRPASVFLEMGHQIVRPMFGPGKDDHPGHLFLFDQMHEKILLAGGIHRIDHLPDPAGGSPLPGDFDHLGFLEDLAGQFPDLVGHGRGEEKGLALGRYALDHGPDVVDEPHVQHPVGLVDDQDLQVLEVDVPLPHVIQQPAGGCDENVQPPSERVDLRVHSEPSHHHRRPQPEVFAVGPDAVMDLHGQLPGGDEDQRPQDRRPSLLKLVEEGKRETGRLAGPGLGAADQVLSLHDGRNGLGLNGGGDRIVLALYGAKDLGA